MERLVFISYHANVACVRFSRGRLFAIYRRPKRTTEPLDVIDTNSAVYVFVAFSVPSILRETTVQNREEPANSRPPVEIDRKRVHQNVGLLQRQAVDLQGRKRQTERVSAHGNCNTFKCLRLIESHAEKMLCKKKKAINSLRP